MEERCDHDHDTGALVDLSKFLETPLNTPPTVVDIMTSSNSLNADSGECSSFTADSDVLEQEKECGLKDSYTEGLAMEEEAKSAHILTPQGNGESIADMETDTDPEDIDELQDDDDGHPGIARLSPSYTDPDADLDEIQDASELAIDVLRKDLDIDEIQDDEEDTRSGFEEPLLAWSLDPAASNAASSPSKLDEIRSEGNGEFAEQALQEMNVEQVEDNRPNSSSSLSPRPSLTAPISAYSILRSSSPAPLPPSTDFDENVAFRSSSPTLLDEVDVENGMVPSAARCESDDWEGRASPFAVSSPPMSFLGRRNLQVPEEGFINQVQHITNTSQDHPADLVIHALSEQGLEDSINEVDVDDGHDESTAGEGLPVLLLSSSPPPPEGPLGSDLNFDEDVRSSSPIGTNIDAFATDSSSWDGLGGVGEDFRGQCDVKDQAGIGSESGAKTEHEVGPVSTSLCVEEPQEKVTIKKLLSAPVPKRATPAILEQQMKKLSRPFQCPAIKQKPKGETNAFVKLQVATEVTGSGLNSASASTTLNKLRYRTARAAAPFKSPVVGCGQTQASNRPSVRLTPAIQTLERKLQLLRRAVKVREEKQEEALRALVNKWTEAGRDVAWEMWMLLKDRQDSGATREKRSYDESWGWSEEKRMKFEETVGGVDGMLMDLGIAPQTLGYGDIGSEFES